MARRYGKDSRRVAAASTTILLLLMVSLHQPKIIRNSFYYSYLACTGRYYAVVRDGKYVDMVAHRLAPAGAGVQRSGSWLRGG